MTELVIDASFASAVLIPAQRTNKTVELIDQWAYFRAKAPYCFSLEVPWALLKYERRISSPGFTLARMSELSRLSIGLEGALDEFDRRAALAVALKHSMGFYDAMYLLLARQTSATLVTRDARLIAVAGQFSVPVLDVR